MLTRDQHQPDMQGVPPSYTKVQPIDLTRQKRQCALHCYEAMCQSSMHQQEPPPRDVAIQLGLSKGGAKLSPTKDQALAFHNKYLCSNALHPIPLTLRLWTINLQRETSHCHSLRIQTWYLFKALHWNPNPVAAKCTGDFCSKTRKRRESPKPHTDKTRKKMELGNPPSESSGVSRCWALQEWNPSYQKPPGGPVAFMLQIPVIQRMGWLVLLQ